MAHSIEENIERIADSLELISECMNLEKETHYKNLTIEGLSKICKNVCLGTLEIREMKDLIKELFPHEELERGK